MVRAAGKIQILILYFDENLLFLNVCPFSISVFSLLCLFVSMSLSMYQLPFLLIHFLLIYETDAISKKEMYYFCNTFLGILFMNLCIYLFIFYSFLYLFIYLSIYLVIYLFITLFISLFPSMLFYLLIYLLIYSLTYFYFYFCILVYLFNLFNLAIFLSHNFLSSAC